MIRRIVALLLAALLVGCASLDAQRPTASLQSMSVGNVTPDGIQLNFLTSVHNPNTFSLPMNGADYDLSVAGVHVISDSAKLEQGLAANASTNVTLPVVLRFDDLLKAKQALVQSGGDIPLAFNGSLRFTPAGSLLPGQSIKVPLSYSGTVPLKRLLNDPQLLMQSSAARQLARSVLGSYFSK